MPARGIAEREKWGRRWLGLQWLGQGLRLMREQGRMWQGDQREEEEKEEEEEEEEEQSSKL